MLDEKDNVPTRLPVSLLNKLELGSVGTHPLSFAYRNVFLSLTIILLNNIVFFFHVLLFLKNVFIAFGGMAATPKLAYKTQNFLILRFFQFHQFLLD